MLIKLQADHEAGLYFNPANPPLVNHYQYRVAYAVPHALYI